MLLILAENSTYIDNSSVIGAAIVITGIKTQMLANDMAVLGGKLDRYRLVSCYRLSLAGGGEMASQKFRRQIMQR